jgi:hypothetical protein
MGMNNLNANLNKKCTKCFISKPITDYYRVRNGYQSYCKLCNKKSILKYSANDREKDKLYRRKRRLEQRELIAEQSKRYAIKNLEKLKTHDKVYQAIQKGLLHKKPCSICGTEKVVAHHPDYSKPLEVEWLCEVHHRAEHNRIKRYEEAFLVYYGMTSEEYLIELYKENGFTYRRPPKDIQTKRNQIIKS